MKQGINLFLIFFLVVWAKPSRSEEVLDNIQREIFQLKTLALQSEKNLNLKTKEYNSLVQNLKASEDKLQILEITLFQRKEKIKNDFVQLSKAWGVLLLEQADHQRHAEYVLSRDKIIQGMKLKSASLKNSLLYASKIEVELSETKKYFQDVKMKTEVLLGLIQKLEQDKISLVGKIQSHQNDVQKKEERLFNQNIEQKISQGEMFISKTFMPPLRQFEKIEKSQQGISFFYRKDSQLLAPAAGKIAYVGELSNYGNVIMIEHDKKMMSVLLGDIITDIRKDAIVTQGSIIGQLPGDRDGGLKTVYYELRFEEKTLPTISYLQMH